MKLLICTDSFLQLKTFSQTVQVQQHDPHLYQFSHAGHDITWLVCGHYFPETMIRLQKLLSADRFHLAIKFSAGLSADCSLPAETIVNIVNEVDTDRRLWTDEGWKDYYTIGWLNAGDHPHVRGGFINMHNAYIQVFMPYKKVVGHTPARMNDPNASHEFVQQYKISVETSNGLPFAYTCLWNKQPFYHLAIIKNNRSFMEEKKQFDFSDLFSHLTALL